MNKEEFVKKLSKKTGMTQPEAKFAIDSMFECFKEALVETGEVKIHGFARFFTYIRPARKARNPITGEAVAVPAKKIFKVKNYFELPQD